MDTININIIAERLWATSYIDDKILLGIKISKSDLINTIINDCGVQDILSQIKQDDIIYYLKSLGYKVE